MCEGWVEKLLLLPLLVSNAAESLSDCSLEYISSYLQVKVLVGGVVEDLWPARCSACAKSSPQSPDTARFCFILMGIGFEMKFGENRRVVGSLVMEVCLGWGVVVGAVAAE